MAIAILYPALAQIVLTLVLLLGMGLQRNKALRSGAVTVDDIALDSTRWPAHARQFGNCYANQFELPVLFYALCLIAQVTHAADLIMVIFAWLFVVSRVAHAYVHTTSNVVRLRANMFILGFVALVVMTVLLLFRLLLTASI